MQESTLRRIYRDFVQLHDLPRVSAIDQYLYLQELIWTVQDKIDLESRLECQVIKAQQRWVLRFLDIVDRAKSKEQRQAA